MSRVRGAVLVRGAVALGALAGAALAMAPQEPAAQGHPASAPAAAHAPGAAEAGELPALEARAAQLLDLALQDGQAYAMLRELTRVAPGRLSGTAAAERAVEWAEDTMRRIGLVRVRREPILVPRWVRGETEELVVLGEGEAADAEPLAVLALGGSVATPPEGVEGELLVVRSFEALRALGERAAGKVVLFNRPMPRALLNTFRAYSDAVPQRTSGAVEAAKVGAVAALVRSMTTRLDDVPHTGSLRYQEGVPPVPAAAVSTAAAERLAALAAAGGAVRVRLRLSCQSLEDAPSANVVGEIRGSALPDEIVVVGAHLDSWDVGEGAHDDGAGCAHVLEAMRLILAAGIQPRRTVRAVLFMNEENGLRGGLGYAERHRDELERHFAAIETDAGGFEPKGFQTSLGEAPRAVLARLLEPLRAHGMGALVPGGGGADIGPMGPAGVALFGMAVASHRYFDYHHSVKDCLEAVNERELALGAAAIAYLAACLAEVELPE
jgi:hypothetical protein